jgi:hypothetical protein
MDWGGLALDVGLFERVKDERPGVVATARRLGAQQVEAVALSALGTALAGIPGSDAVGSAIEYLQRAATMLEVVGNRRMQGSLLVNLALVFEIAGDLPAAECAARSALEVVESVPPLRTFALGVLARILLAQGPSSEALIHATEAYRLLTSLGGAIENGEAHVRLAYARALNVNGRIDEARSAAAAARERLLARAATIARDDWRTSFLERVSENAETLAFVPG